jgi:hypothetical protein
MVSEPTSPAAYGCEDEYGPLARGDRRPAPHRDMVPGGVVEP